MTNGLKFNPLNGFGNNAQDTSVPTTASDYLTLQPVLPVPQWKPSQLEKAKGMVNWAIEHPIEEGGESYFLRDLNKWKKGIAGLDDNEFSLFENSLSDETRNQTEPFKDRVWKNQQFVKNIGMDAFLAIPDADRRDKIYEDYLLDKAIVEKYSTNENLEQLRSLTADGKMKLLESNYASDWQLKQEKEDTKKKNNTGLFDYLGNLVVGNWDEVADATKKWADHSLMERWNAITSDAVEQGKLGMGVGTAVGTAFAGVGAGPGLAMGGLTGMLSGILTGIAHPEDGAEATLTQRKIDNENTLSKIIAADNEKKKEEARDDIDAIFVGYQQALERGQITTKDGEVKPFTEKNVDEIFDAIALNGKRTSEPDEFGNTEEYDYVGSNYYSAFKDTDEFEHFTTYDKLKYIAQTEALANRYGNTAAMSILDQDMQNYVSDHQNWLDWGSNTLKNIWVGGIANLGLSYTAAAGFAAYNYYGAKGAANYLAGNDDESENFLDAYHNAGAKAEAEYLQGRDASGNGESNNLINNPSYWNKVDQYNDLGIDMSGLFGKGWGNHQEEAERNGGISTSSNVVRAGEEGDAWSWNTFNEALRMNKFAWSDLLKNYGLAKIIRLGVGVAGGAEVAGTPGVLTAESSAAAQFINKAGHIGIVNASSLGIDAAYGMQTFDEVLKENNSRLDKLIDKEVQEEVKERLQSRQSLQEFQNYVDAENAKRRAKAGESGKWIPVDEDKAWQDYARYIEKEIREKQELAHADDRKRTEIDAANAYIADATIEHARMAATNGVFKSYLFDKGTLNAIRANNPYVNTTVRNGAYALGKNAARKKALNTAWTHVWGGFHSNYFDDVTVGFAKGLGIQNYNNYLLTKYNPAAYGAVIDEYVNPLVAGMMGANNAMEEGRSFLDGGVGAVGAVFTAAPNISGMRNHKDRMKELAESIEESGSKNGMHWTEWMGDFVNNPILEAVARAKQSTRMTEQAIKRANDIINEHGYAFDNMVETLGALNQKAIARQGTSLIEAKDAKDREAFVLATALLDMKNNNAVVNAQAEPDKAAWSMKKKASSAVGNALNSLFGVQSYEDAESAYTRAMNTLQEASSIGDGEMTSTQEELVNTFLGLDANKSTVKDMSDTEKVKFAQERLKENSANLLEMMDKAEKVKENLDKSVVSFSPDVKQQLLYQYVLDSRWKARLEDVEKQITGDDEITRNNDETSNLTAKYGSKHGWARALDAQEKRVEQAENLHRLAKEELKKEADPIKSRAENSRINYQRRLAEASAKELVEEEKAKLQKLEHEGTLIEDDERLPIIKAEDILRLNADERLRMLDDYYRDDYSTEQQEEIDRAKSLMMRDGITLDVAMENVRDAAILTHRIEDNMKAAKNIMKKPVMAANMVSALKANRQRAIVDYFNDKVVQEAFMDFAADKEALISDKTVADKARGYSNAVLNGMQEAADREIRATNRKTGLYDPDLKNIIDGINTVLTERRERAKDTVGLNSYLNKTKKVNHTETVEHPIFNGETGEVEEGVFTVEQVTTEKELSQNDRKLLEYALDYAAEKGYSIDELAEKTATEDFDEYVMEKNHSYEIGVDRRTNQPVPINVGTVENRANPVSHDYMRSLVDDVVASYNTNKEEAAKAKQPKETNAKPESVAEAPVEVKGENQRDESKREKEPEARKGIRLTELPVEGKQENPSEKEGLSRNDEILENISPLNEDLTDDISALLDIVDSMNATAEAKEAIKDAVEAITSTSGLKDVKALQNKIFRDLGNQKAEIAKAAQELLGVNVEARKKAAKTVNKKIQTDKSKNSRSESTFNLKEPPMVLETMDFDDLNRFFPAFAQNHRIGSFLQRLYNAWKDDNANKGKRHQAQAVFIYDPVLASQEEESKKRQGKEYFVEQDAPIIMALEIDDRNRDLIEDDSQLIYVKEVPNGRSHYYQPLGLMPASTHSANATESSNDTAARMSAIRNRIEFVDRHGHPNEGPTIIRVKKNGTPIQGNLDTPTVDVTKGERPEGTRETPKNSVQQLMEENLLSPSEAFAEVSKEQIAEYEDAKKKGLLGKLRNTDMYKKMKEIFIQRIAEETTTDESTGKPDTHINFKIRKGTRDSWPRRILTKAIGSNTVGGESMQSYDRNNPSRTIVSMLRDIDSEGETAEEKENKAEELLKSNSRFSRLFTALSALKIPEGLFRADGIPVNARSIAEAENNLKSSIYKHIDNNFNVDNLNVAVKFESDDAEGKPRHSVNISILSGSDELASITLPYKPDVKISKEEFATLMKHMILGEDGNTRKGINDPRYERVKWQVRYKDATTANDSESKQQTAANTNLGQLFDDGILVIQTTKLAYPSKTVSIGKSGMTNLKDIYTTPEAAQPDVQPAQPTETKASFEAETKEGKVDPDSGTHTEAPTKESILNGLAQNIKDIIKEMIERSKDRNIDSNNEKHYNIMGQLHSRVTSIKYAMEGMHDRFNPTSGWALPSSALGDSFDDFGRDVFNGIFDDVSDAERTEAFKTYENSTEKNYAKAYLALKEFEARLLSKGQVIIATGNKTNPGKITVMGTVDVTINKDGKLEARKARVAGTLDVLAIDKYGQLYIYDFKTHRTEEFDKGVAINKGYDRQLSMYAEFLEKEYGLHVAGISIIPIKVNYDTPDGTNNDGTPIEHPQKHYKKADIGNQLLWVEASQASNPEAVYREFTDADFQVEKEFDLTRLKGDALIASYEKMTADEIQALEDAVVDQSENPAADATKEISVVEAKPEIKKEQKLSDEEREGYGDDVEGFSFFDDATSSEDNKVTEDTEKEALNDIDPENSLNEKIEEQNKNCRK